MDTVSNWDHKAVIRELRKGLELVKQLMLHLSSASSSYETSEMLLLRILSSYEKTLLTLSKAGSAARQPRPVGPAAVPKKRRILSTGTNQPKDDGYSWRKYAMEIGDKYPRHYYICRYRHDQCCKATKQTQRPDDDDDDDPTVLNITYIGSHTCSQVSHTVLPSASPEKQEPKENNNHQQQQQQQQTNETFLNVRASRRINTEELNYKTFLMFVVVLFVLYMCLLACVVLMFCV